MNEPEWIAGEVRSLLTAGRVGLYEFLWLQRSFGDRAELKRRSAAALRQLLAEGHRRLVRCKWGSDEQLPLPEDYAVRDEDWDDIPEDSWYVAIVDDPPQGSKRGGRLR